MSILHYIALKYRFTISHISSRVLLPLNKKNSLLPINIKISGADLLCIMFFIYAPAVSRIVQTLLLKMTVYEDLIIPC